ncbi:Tat pathway signal protein [Streptomyces sp. PTM05]|uniref:Tat pathway signal protein n=1 Tax=Streptantibioticus parmotrematis TaxID=2873249 RepID=A0ABS7QND5_9ACTN|nr:Tat pathway signal protein [Streptantibioticus parmotrematis]MBY8884678.1 Tat pathway signal protein [Streptantibioticus parmotrematis]
MSADRAVTLAPDIDGVHVLAADSSKAYKWHTVTTLSEPGFASDLWTGNYCLPDRSHAVVVYAPRQFADNQELMERGAFAAVVDLDTGTVKKLAVNASLAYFDPSCDTRTHTAAITQIKGDQTRLATIDASGKTLSTITANGEITSATPAGGGIVGAFGNKVVRIDRSGRSSAIATATGTPYSIREDASGGIDFLDQTKTTQEARRVASNATVTLATGAIGQIGLADGVGGQVFLLGNPKRTAALPTAVKRLKAAPESNVSTDGALAVNAAISPALRTHAQNPLADIGDPATANGRVQIQATLTSSGKAVGFSADASPDHQLDTVQGAALSPSLPASPAPSKRGSPRAAKTELSATAASDANSTVDADRYCSITRNDPNTMALQPTPNQVEWAVDMAVRGDLTSNWIQQSGWRAAEGLGTVNPQGMFPLPKLNGGGNIPSQVLLGILTQESNLWQATSHAEPGELGNPLIGNFYGTNIYPGTAGYDPDAIWKIDWDKSDCGYGIGQVTDGMRMAGHTKAGETALAPDQQRALALDYTVNIAYAAQLLAEKWNELHSSTVSLKINNDDPSKIENWFAAAWDYNSGFNPPGAASNWGLGWYNNPANPLYPASRHPFLDGNTYSDAAHPQDWPYEEKVMGWAAWPIDTGRSYDDNGNEQQKGDPGFNSAGYAAAWWTTDAQRSAIKPPLNTFCDSSNACDISSPPTCETGHSGDPSCDTPHWWNKSATWKPDCASSCGNASIRYVTLRMEPSSADPSPPPCDTSGLSSGSVVIDDVPTGTATPRCPMNTFKSQGSFAFTFPQDSDGHYEAREDLQQIGGGFDGHYWFSHGRQDGNWGNLLETTGTWTPNSLPAHLYQIRAYMPYLGEKTKTAAYKITTADGTVYTRTVDQSSVTGGWITVGYFNLSSNAKVQLTNITTDPTSGDTTVAYDALALTPVTGTWQHHTFTAAAIFPSDINLDTDLSSLPSWAVNTPLRGRQALYDWANSLSSTLAATPLCAGGTTGSNCISSDMSTAMKKWSSDVETAGTNPNNSPSEADWMGFSIATPPKTITAHTFDDDHSYKIKTVIDTSWVSASDGTVVPGTEHAEYTARSGTTTLPTFVTAFMNATENDYAGLGVTVPDLAFSATNANTYGHSEFVNQPVETGFTPGEEYAPKESPASIDSTGKCVDTKIISGGVIGYRMLDAQSSTDKNVAAWKNNLSSLASAGKIPQAVATAAGDIYSMFFRAVGIDNGSLFNIAPPIWQNVSMAFCGDGSVHNTQSAPDTDDNPEYGIVYASHMPDEYLYLDNRLVDENGKATDGPVQKGDYANFTEGGYGLCQSAGRGNGGNPWAITMDSSAGVNPDNAAFCDAYPPPPVS